MQSPQQIIKDAENCWQNSQPTKGMRTLVPGFTSLVMALWLLFACLSQTTAGQESSEHHESNEASLRKGYLINVDLPLVGARDDQVRQQINQLLSRETSSQKRPIVVLRFAAASVGIADESAATTGSRGSQFERSLSLARFLVRPNVSRLRLVAYLPETVEGHAVLPVLACEDIVAAPGAEFGAAAIDEPADAFVVSTYRDLVAGRAAFPPAAVEAMLKPDVEVIEIQEVGSGQTQIVNTQQLAKLREEGRVSDETNIWPGGGLAVFSAENMAARRWTLGAAGDLEQLASLLRTQPLKSLDKLPRSWEGVTVKLSGELTTPRVNQLIRSLTEEVEESEKNLILFEVEPTRSTASVAMRLANFVADLESKDVFTVSVSSGAVQGPVIAIATACNEAILLEGGSFGPLPEEVGDEIGLETPEALHLGLDELAQRTDRPLPLLAAATHHDVLVKEYVQQKNGQKSLFTDWQIEQQADRDLWLEKRVVAGGETLDTQLLVRYRLIDSAESDTQSALASLGIASKPAELKLSWIDSAIQLLVMQSWLPRVLLMVAFFSLMAELGNPGIGVGGFLSALCFVGFFWIEGLNGNVESLEIILFIFGLIALLMEVFVIPGFGIFGIGGLLMLLVSVVLASQTFVWPSNSSELGEVSLNLFWVACLALGGMIGLLFMHKQLERSPLLRWVTLDPVGPEELDSLEMRETTARREHLYAQQGMTTTRLNPSGKAQFGSDIVSVVGTGKMIGKGVPVQVVEVRGPLVIVEELDLGR